MTSREQFEDFIDENFGFKKDRFRMFRGEYQSQFTKQMWESWQASREAVEIELPSVTDAADWIVSVDVMESDHVISAIRAAGIKVKGE